MALHLCGFKMVSTRVQYVVSRLMLPLSLPLTMMTMMTSRRRWKK
jgi:hypothetical protein